MARALVWQDILASLTTNPSAFFKATTKGRLQKGMEADPVVLDADPAESGQGGIHNQRRQDHLSEVSLDIL
jgi:predicted amidohydrolase YtcJ